MSTSQPFPQAFAGQLVCPAQSPVACSAVFLWRTQMAEESEHSPAPVRGELSELQRACP